MRTKAFSPTGKNVCTMLNNNPSEDPSVIQEESSEDEVGQQSSKVHNETTQEGQHQAGNNSRGSTSGWML